MVVRCVVVRCELTQNWAGAWLLSDAEVGYQAALLTKELVFRPQGGPDCQLRIQKNMVLRIQKNTVVEISLSCRSRVWVPLSVAGVVLVSSNFPSLKPHSHNPLEGCRQAWRAV